MTAPSLAFTGAEFDALWAGLGEETMPDPFIYSCPERSADEGALIRRQDWAALRARLGGELDDLVETIRTPDIRIVVTGFGVGKRADEPADALRLLAVRKGDIGYLITQRPGETLYDASGFAVSIHDATSLGQVVACALPERAGGREREIELTEPASSELDYGYGRSLVQHYDDEVATKASAFLAAPAEHAGSIAIEQGWSRFGPRGLVRLRVYWRDVVDDGRYLVMPGPPMVAVGADRARVTDLVNGQIAEVVSAIVDDRA
ncbi:ESX secretion-associated protein EspG [Nocardia camponoti]|uniref:ESX secretion-associated protein EspG n=1 Tax=Nocardia camponoti TaxID=1616106 RepID=A0A917QM80_9NOCA|nr:ESX secretion-associated protein EspG [Nocardia camponoti]GGK57555.1 hypothetical protein GCM10011591_32130 [Nocardia camponoti]